MSTDSYEVRLQAERAEKAARIASFARHMEMGAIKLQELGEGVVRFAQATYDDVPVDSGLLTFEDGLELLAGLYRDGYHARAKYRIRFSMSVPRGHDGRVGGLRDYGVIGYNDPIPEISVSFDAPAERVAKDLRRRLIEGFGLRTMLAKVRESLAARAAYADGKARLASELFGLMKQPIRESELSSDRAPTIRLYGIGGVSYGSLAINGPDSVKIEASVDAALARAFLELLVSRKGVANG